MYTFKQISTTYSLFDKFYMVSGEDFSSAEALLEAVFSLDQSRTSENEPDVAMQELRDEDLSSATALSGGSENPDSLRLAEENRVLKEQRQCKICMDEEVCVAFIPCGHLVCCLLVHPP
uniref:RING-type domain-containing protein n=1 Tax=Arion vulgaris TaxID=1028688 RepID=A0A0B7A2L3_9EUPU